MERRVGAPCSGIVCTASGKFERQRWCDVLEVVSNGTERRREGPAKLTCSLSTDTFGMRSFFVGEGEPLG